MSQPMSRPPSFPPFIDPAASMPERKPAVAGPRNFYPDRPAELRALVESCYRSPVGPGRLPGEPPHRAPGRRRKIVAAVVPHAGLVYSGPEAAWAWLALHEEGLPESFVIFAPNHRGLGRECAVYDAGSWASPLSPVPVDQPLARALAAAPPFAADPSAHRLEHSIEVQLPFLTHLAERTGRMPAIVPVAMTDPGLDDARACGRRAAEAAGELARDTVCLASSDFSHYVPRAFAMREDPAAIARLLEFDVEGFLGEVSRRGLSPCGVWPVVATVEYARARGAVAARLLKYGTSGDIIDHPEVVGYAAIVFETAAG